MDLSKGYSTRVNGFLFVLRSETCQRLSPKCFRGPQQKVAGNFHRWGNPHEFFEDQLVFAGLAKDVEEIKKFNDFGTHSVTISYGQSVGWSSTLLLAECPEGVLESFTPNRKSQALRVKPACTHILAPQTAYLTVVFECKQEGKGSTARIVSVLHSVYPGPDIGELSGDITAREKIAFFDWEHPGA